MKKALFIISVLLCTMLFSSCGENKEINVSEQHIQYGQRALEIADQYIDYEISASKAYEMLESLADREAELPDISPSDKNRSGNSNVETYTFLLKCEISLSVNNPTDEKYSSIIKHRNAIADVIGAERK